MRVFRLRPGDRAPDAGAIFQGEVHTRRFIAEAESATHRVAEVAFRDGGRTKLHNHTTDQVLVITEGRGLVGTRDDRHEVTVGDVVLIPAGEAHFHGAAPGHDMTHLSILGPSRTTILED